MTTDPTTPTTDPTSPVPAPPQSVRIETTLWWEDFNESSNLLVGPKCGADGTRLVKIIYFHRLPNPWKWAYLAAIDPHKTWHNSPTREAAKAAALQAVMGAIGARKVGAGPSAEQIQQRIAEGQAIVANAERSLEKLFRESNTTIIGSGKPP